MSRICVFRVVVATLLFFSKAFQVSWPNYVMIQEQVKKAAGFRGVCGEAVAHETPVRLTRATRRIFGHPCCYFLLFLLR